MLRISQCKVKLDQDISILEDIIRVRLKLNKRIGFKYHIHKRNVDARNKNEIFFVYSVDVNVNDEKKIMRKHPKGVTLIKQPYNKLIEKGFYLMKHRPIVVGFGPSGIFAALLLAQNGYCPIVFERGEDVDQRSITVDTFFEKGILNEDSNIQFGEGGAGTFSDGKLTARSKDSRVQKIYETFVEFGAPEEILYDSLPHLGSDKLKEIIKRIRNEIIRLGGEIHFSSKVEELIIEDNKIKGIVCNKKVYESEHLILAIGNSARDSAYDFHKQGLEMQSKPFAIGVRIEHKQSMINKSLYHDFASHPSLPEASYHLSHIPSTNKGVYTFCMCPGGMVVAATSLKERVVVNGMSNYARELENANSAILVQVDASDYGEGLFAGMKFVDELEKKAFVLGGSNYQALTQRVVDFLDNKTSTYIGEVKPSYPLGVKLGNLHDLLPKHICLSLQEGLKDFNTKIHGFANEDAILCAVETRSSSPIRIVRDKDTLISTSIKGIYPSGEGAGYAGGIISSAIDGLKCAEKIISEVVWEEQ